MSPRVTPEVSWPSGLRRRMRNACAPRDFPPISRLATTTAQSAVQPWLIQFFTAPSYGECRMNPLLASSHVHSVSTTSPELTPANFSVSPKQPRPPASWMRSSSCRCSDEPSASTVPAKRLYCTVKRMPNPGPRRVAKRLSWWCAAKKRAGASRRSVSSSAREATSERSRADARAGVPPSPASSAGTSAMCVRKAASHASSASSASGEECCSRGGRAGGRAAATGMVGELVARLGRVGRHGTVASMETALGSS
mmetsp:Transcript_31439/g.81298  ORF Transcript_31439/g.81298 Transcript_31439/m.81298 type:complete len:253 (-) Transcript_31439:93-851(-)